MDSRIQRAATILGREIRDDEQGSVASLDTFPVELRKEARIIAKSSTVLALAFIRYYVDSANLGDAVRFMEEVIASGD